MPRDQYEPNRVLGFPVRPRAARDRAARDLARGTAPRGTKNRSAWRASRSTGSAAPAPTGWGHWRIRSGSSGAGCGGARRVAARRTMTDPGRDLSPIRVRGRR